MSKNDRPEGVDQELLNELEEELASDERARKRNIFLVAGGVIAGLVAIAYFSFSGGAPGVADHEFGNNMTSTSNPDGRTPQIDGAPTTESADTRNKQDKEVEPTKDEPPSLEKQIALLQEKNMIGMDEEAPGAVDEKSTSNGKETLAVQGPSLDKESPGLVENSLSAKEIDVSDVYGAESGTGVDESADNTTDGAPDDKNENAQKSRSEKPAELAKKSETRANSADPVRKSAIIPKKKVASISTKTFKKARKIKGQNSKKVKKADTNSGQPYFVQIMSTTDDQTAIGMRDKLRKKGFDAWVLLGKTDESVHSVLVGQYETVKEASATSGKMGLAGFKTKTAYLNPGPGVTLSAGVFQSSEEAEELSARIQDAGFPAFVSSESNERTLYNVRVGRYKTESEATKKHEAVIEAGFTATGVSK